MNEYLTSLYRNNLSQVRSIGIAPILHYTVTGKEDLKELIDAMSEFRGYIQIKIEGAGAYKDWSSFDSGIRYWLIKGNRKPTEKVYFRKVNGRTRRIMNEYHVNWEYREKVS